MFIKQIGNTMMLNTLCKLLDDKNFKIQVKHTFKNITANEKILAEGIVHEYLYVIQKGKVRILVRGETRDNPYIHPSIADLGPGDIFGEFTLYNDLPSSADIIAVTNSELIAIEKKSFRAFLESNTDIGYKVISEIFKLYVQRLLHSNKTIINLLYWGIEARNIDKYLK